MGRMFMTGSTVTWNTWALGKPKEVLWGRMFMTGSTVTWNTGR